MSWRIIPSRHPRMISKRIRTMANEMKTICQSGEPAVPISDSGPRITPIDANKMTEIISEKKKLSKSTAETKENRDCRRLFLIHFAFIRVIRGPQPEIANRLLSQRVIAKHQRGHRLDDWHSARQDTGIMAAARR